MPRLLFVSVCLLAAGAISPSASSELDTVMSRVLERRDENWKKLQQYTLKERKKLQVTALGVLKLYGFEREYLWFPRQGFFVRSPLRADGVAIGEEERRAAEDRWLQRAREREAREQEQDGGKPSSPSGADASRGGSRISATVEDVVRQSFEPDFIESAHFLKFPFEPGRYALVGWERMLDRDVLRIEYYPEQMFHGKDEPQTREDGAESDDFDEERFAEQMSKVSLVTLWVDPERHQILRYEFRNIDMDFLPAQWIVRVDSVRATMQMAEPFPEVWLPASVGMRFRIRLASGPFEGRYDVAYTDYRLPEVKGRIVQ